MKNIESQGFVFMPALSPFIGPILFRITRKNCFELAMKIGADHINPLQACHGGVMMTLADSVMAGVISYDIAPQKVTPTVSLTCNFIRSAMLGDSIIARAKVSRCTNSLVFATCSVHLTSNLEDLIFTGNGIYYLPKENTPGFNIHTTMRQAYAKASMGIANFAS
jgi:uncharacterized protein (TIGR00369 family)